MTTIISTLNGDIESGDLAEELPSREFRDAWVLDGAVIELDPEAMKPIATLMVDAVRDEKRVRVISTEGLLIRPGSLEIGATMFSTPSQRIITADNKIETVTHDAFTEIFKQVAAYVSECDILAREKKNDILASRGVSEVQGFVDDIGKGWPDTGI